jgi:ribosomal protein L29
MNKDYDAIKLKSRNELLLLLFDLKKEEFILRFQLTSNQLSNTSLVKKCRKSIARVLTCLAVLKKLEKKSPK